MMSTRRHLHDKRRVHIHDVSNNIFFYKSQVEVHTWHVWIEMSGTTSDSEVVLTYSYAWS